MSKDILRPDDESECPRICPYHLLNTHTVPVWDGSNSTVNFVDDWNEVVNLPRFDGEIPSALFVVVAHALSATTAEDPYLNMNFNILWAVVIATPHGEAPAAPSGQSDKEDKGGQQLNATASGSGARVD